MSTTYDWSPAIQGLLGIAQRQKYQSALSSLFGTPETTPAQPAGQLNTPLPQMSLPGASVQPANPASKGASPIQMQPLQVGGGNLSINTPATPQMTSYNGPAAQALGQDQTAALLPMLSAMSPQEGMQLFPQLLLKSLDRKQEIADKAITPLTDQEAAKYGLRPGGVYGRDVSGNISTIQPSDMKSPGAIQQQEDVAALEQKLKSGAPLTAYEKAQLADSAANRQEKVREFDATNPMGAGGAGGLDFSKAPVATQNTVRSMLEGRMAPPTGMALRTPYWQNMMALANTVDPNFDQTVWAGRYGTRKDVEGGGKTYQMMNSGNTAIQHLGRLNDQISTVSGVQFPLVGNLINRGVNAAELGSGHVGVNTYNDTLGHVSEETTKFYRMTGGNEADIQRTMENLSPNLSTAQKKDGVANTVHLIFGALQPKVEQYNKIMGTDYPVSHFLSSKSIQTMKKMGFDPDTGEALQAPAGGAAPAQPAQGGTKVRVYNPATGKLE